MERPRLKGKKKWWTQEQRMEVISQYAIYGNLEEVARNTRVPIATIRSWKKLPWWEDFLGEIRRDIAERDAADLGKIVKRGLAVVEDRLENGNHVFDQKTGRIERVPVNIKDALKVSTDLM